MLSDKQKRTALMRTIKQARNTAYRLRAEGVEEITLVHYAVEKAFRTMQLPEEGDDFQYRQLVNTAAARVIIAHGLRLWVQPLNAKEYSERLGSRQNTYRAQYEYPGGRHMSGDEAIILLRTQVVSQKLLSDSISSEMCGRMPVSAEPGPHLFTNYRNST